MFQKIVFVYNADSGPMNAILDYAHKLISPKTYACSLCALTYHTFGEKNKWKEFRKKSPHKMEFLHRDEFYASYPNSNLLLPVVFVDNSEQIEVLMNNQELGTTKSLDDLIDVLTQKLDTNWST